MNLKDRSVLIIDGGLFVSLAERLVRDFGRVGFFSDWTNPFPDGRELIVGSGLDGITREKYLWKCVNDYDLIVYPDVWRGDEQEYLRSQNKRVWGSGMGSDLELARWKTHELLPKMGLPQNEAVQIHGTYNLRAFIKEHPKVFVKISAFRGIGETWFAENYDMAKGQIDELDSKHGPMAAMLDFICEDAISDAKEIGYDGYAIDGEFPNQAVIGYECKDKAYFGKACKYDDLPQIVRDTNTALAYQMRDGYRQFFSTEIREKDGKGYLIDVTCRHASPGGEVYCEMFTNLADILWNGAAGVRVEPEIDEPYGAQIILCSEWAEEHFQLIEFPDEIRQWVKLYNHCRVDGHDYTVPQEARMKQVGSVIGLGKTPEEAVSICKERAKQVHGFDLESEADSLDECVELMDGE